MHHFEGFAKVVVLIFCFMIAFRMMMDTLRIKNGKNLFLIDKPKQLIILSIALGINALIAGLIADAAFIPLFGKITPLYIIGISLIWGLIGIGTKFSQTKLLINSLLNVVAALAILATGFVDASVRACFAVSAVRLHRQAEDRGGVPHDSHRLSQYDPVRLFLRALNA